MTIVYYIVYEAWENGKSMGRGSCEAIRVKPIAYIEDINEIEDSLKDDMERLSNYNIQIINYQFLRYDE